MLQQKTVYQSFKPLYYLSLLLGCMPLRLSGQPELRQSRLLRSYSVLCFTLSLAHAVATSIIAGGETKIASTLATAIEVRGNTTEVVNFIRNQTSVQKIAMRTMNPLVVSLMGVAAFGVSAVFVRRRLAGFFEELHQVDQLLRRVAGWDPIGQRRLTYGAVVYFFALSSPVSSYYLWTSWTAIQNWEFIWNIYLMVNNFASFTIELQFVTLSMYLFLRLRLINACLRKHIPDAPINYFFIQRLFPQQEQRSPQEAPSKKSSALSLRQVELLHKSNRKLCDLMSILESIYQVQLLSSTSGCFVKILFNVYFAINAEVSGTITIFQAYFKVLCWTVYYTLRFLHTIIAASLTSNEALKTKCIIPHVYSRNMPREVKEEMGLFMNHASNWTMKFTACGLFCVTTKLITSAVATGTTYMVVLIQFRPQI